MDGLDGQDRVLAQTNIAFDFLVDALPGLCGQAE